MNNFSSEVFKWKYCAVFGKLIGSEWNWDWHMIGIATKGRQDKCKYLVCLLNYVNQNLWKINEAYAGHTENHCSSDDDANKHQSEATA